MSPSLICREATKADLSFLVKAEALAFPSDAGSESLLCAHLESSVGRATLLEVDGECVAYLLSTVIPPEGEVLRIATLPAHRKNGYAKILLSAFLEDLPLCFLEVRESNTPARLLYESLGFVLTGKRPSYYQNPTEDACLYKKDDDTHIRL